MENQEQQLIQPQTPIKPIQSITPETQSKKPFKKTWILIAVVVLAVIITGFAGAYILGKNSTKTSTLLPSSNTTVNPIQDSNLSNNLNQSSTTKATPTATPTPDPTANWQTYNDKGVSYQYPENWKTQYNFTNYADTAVYDPNSMHTVVGNGGSQVQLPTVFFDVQKVTNTTQTAKSYADDYTSGIPYNQLTASELQRQNSSANGLQMELFTAQGEGNIGKYLILSNGAKIAVVNTSLINLNGKEVENLILSTFKFTQ